MSTVSLKSRNNNYYWKSAVSSTKQTYI